MESIDRQVSLPLPNLIEYDKIPDNRSEIPTPFKVNSASDPRMRAQDTNHTSSQSRLQVNSLHNAPYVQKFDLG